MRAQIMHNKAMHNKTLKVGLIGLGKMGRNHLRVLSMLKGVELAFIADADGDLAEHVPPQPVQPVPRAGLRRAEDRRVRGRDAPLLLLAAAVRQARLQHAQRPHHARDHAAGTGLRRDRDPRAPFPGEIQPGGKHQENVFARGDRSADLRICRLAVLRLGVADLRQRRNAAADPAAERLLRGQHARPQRRRRPAPGGCRP